MRVAKTKQEVEGRSENEKKICYKVYDDETKREKDMEVGKNIWVVHQFEEFLDDIGQKAYQDFVCGFLHYYDTELRNGSIDHIVHFKWEQRQTAQGKNYVTVYLNPPPRLTPAHPKFKPGEPNPPGSFGSITDPPPPTGPPPPPPR